MHGDRSGHTTTRLLVAVGDCLLATEGSRLVQVVGAGRHGQHVAVVAELPAGEQLRILAASDNVSMLLALTSQLRLLGWAGQFGRADQVLDLQLELDAQIGLDAVPAAAAAGDFGGDGEELVAVTADGELWALREDDLEGVPWSLLGASLGTVGLASAASGSSGSAELYSVTYDGVVSRWLREPSNDNGSGWFWREAPDEGVEAASEDPVVAIASWSSLAADDQAVLTASGRLHQRWREVGGTDWSQWWSGPPAPSEHFAAAIAGWSAPNGDQTIAALDTGGNLAFRRWSPDGGEWQPWKPGLNLVGSVHYPDATTGSTSPGGAAAATANEPFPRTSPDRATGQDAGPTPRLDGDQHATLAASEDQAKSTAHEDGDKDDDAAGTQAFSLTELEETDPDADTERQHGADERQASTERAAAATRLFTGRELPPLRPDDPERVGPFKLSKRVEGGQASTDKFVARDGRGFCFLKVLRPDAEKPEVSAFQRECELAARLVGRRRLPNFVEAHPEADASGPAYLALSFEEGPDLHEMTHGKPMTGLALVGLARSLAEALVELQECQLVHVDIKPANVVIRTGGFPVLVDLGSAVLLTASRVGEGHATLGYVAPEFFDRLDVSATTDVYAWGAVVLAAATGRTPAADPAQDDIAGLPAPLPALVASALSRDPGTRPAPKELLKKLPRPRERPPVRKGLPVDGLEPAPLRAGLSPSLTHFQTRLATLSVWNYRLGLLVVVVAGSVVGLVLGVVLGTLVKRG